MTLLYTRNPPPTMCSAGKLNDCLLNLANVSLGGLEKQSRTE